MANVQPIVNISDGRLRGCIKIDWRGGKYYSFQGIPYGKPPIGNLRFKAPQPAVPWSEIKDATREGSDCWGEHLFSHKPVGSEDGLFLNVYTPELPNNNKPLMPVMVWVHGGGFQSGSGSTELYGPDFLITEGIVLVTINYRLGILGFASFSDPTIEIPGNAGFKDQVLALKWVQKNISNFGGDPGCVTIFGESAGAASVHLLMLSPLTKGLFHRVIAQSGVGTVLWAQNLPTAALVAEVLGLRNQTEKDIVKILNELPVEKLLEIQRKIRISLPLLRIPFSLALESPEDKSAFLTRNPRDILLAGDYSKVPLMIGFTSKEGIFFEFYQKSQFGKEKWNLDFEDVMPFKHLKEDAFTKGLAERIKQFYFGKEKLGPENVDRYDLFHMDTLFLIAIDEAVRLHTQTSSAPAYYYRISIDTRLNLFKKLIGISRPGASHGDEIGYLFKNQATPIIGDNSPEDIGLRRFLKLWTTFAKNGDPNPTKQDGKIINVTWPPVKSNTLYYLDISDNLAIGINPERERIEFWNEISSLYYSHLKENYNITNT